MHRRLLETQAKELYDIVLSASDESKIKQGFDRGFTTWSFLTVHLPDVDAKSFLFVLAFVYTGKVPRRTDEVLARNILREADRFGCKTLEFYAESTLVEKFLAPPVAAGLLLLADSHSCALL
ncbi:unnamed protein product [Pseudo-nitzschia multistriata]|uniref:BTB domain-containing protein n=1 Tax=Pseudo-nitzschia multistriata TaxID=183589 RepID=A0A448ZQ09_9STRA|nr:unnamed protein product [Pseudo-nitzschia multistriata]